MRWPAGLTGSGVTSGLKPDGALDLGLLVAERPVSWAGTFTANAAAAAPVQWSQSLLGKPARAVVVNSGNANACTGSRGADAVSSTIEAAGRVIGCSPDEVLVASTGPIGVALPVERLIAALPAAVRGLGTDPSAFATAILTTDTRTKVAARGAGGPVVVGVAKGAAMLAPGMATMLAFIATDAAVDAGDLQTQLTSSVDETFNRICVDACESTNDSVFLLATGRAGRSDPQLFAKALNEVCSELAEAMVRDAEGGTRVVRIRVRGAADDARAVALGKSVAASALWRAAAHGGDPNWGRVVAALGSRDRGLDPRRLSVALGDVLVMADGEPAGDVRAAAEAMKEPEIRVTCTVGRGPGSAEVLTADLSPAYVALNAGGMS